MRAICLLLVLSASGSLTADVITTPNGVTFEGVVSVFDKDKKLTLATGYGDLTFTVATDIADASVADYTWPVSALTKKPARAASFEKWVKGRVAGKAVDVDANQFAWRKVAKTMEPKETKPEVLWGAMEKYLNASGDPDKSVKERDAALAAFKKFDGNWFYACHAVDTVLQNGDELEVTFIRSDGRWNEATERFEGEGFVVHDPRTGNPTTVAPSSIVQVGARKGVNGADTDALNSSKLHDVVYVDYSEASGWKRGSGVVFRIELKFDDEVWTWIMKPTRLQPLVEPKVAKD